jgi:DNA-binding NtrC family response regulator
VKWVSFIPAVSRRSVVQAAQDDRTSVYLSGETGSGKSAIARWIHQNSPRSARPLVIYKQSDDLAARAAEAENGTLVIQELDSFNAAARTELAKLIKTHSLMVSEKDGQPPVRKMIRARIIATGSRPIQEFTTFEPLFQEFRIHLPS